MAALSLKKKFVRYTAFPFLLLAVLLVVFIGYMDLNVRQTRSDAELRYRVQALGNSFSAYLSRAEFEAKYLAKQAGEDESLDSLFQLHDVLFFGGLDFFYIELKYGQTLEDPRVRLYTEDAPKELALEARLNFWRHVSTTDQGEFLVYKRALPNDESGQVKGYLYGFVSLNNNLALASDLMAGADVDYMRIDDVAGHTLLHDQLSTYSNKDLSVGYTDVLALPSVANRFTVELRSVNPYQNTLSRGVVISALVILIGLLILFAWVLFNARRWMFYPVANLPSIAADEPVKYKEFGPMMMQMNRFHRQLKAQEQHFNLLLDSLHSAILFCDESAHITAINQEAKHIFPDHRVAKTIFDMTPLACHRPIQRALKGEFGGEFELEFAELDKVYKWYTYSFINEYGFRSVMLVGRDVSELSRLRWQLTHLLPHRTLERPQPAPEVLIQEIELLGKAHVEDSLVAPQQWLLLISQLLTRMTQIPKKGEEALSLGQVLMEQQEEVDHVLVFKEQQSLIEFDIPIDVALQRANWSSDHKMLFQVALLLCMSSPILGRRLAVRWLKGNLIIQVYGIAELSPAMTWILDELPKLVKGQVEYEGTGRVQISVTVAALDDPEPLAIAEKTLALITNDYHAVDRAQSVLDMLDITVEVFSSFDEFFNSNRVFGRVFDAVLIGVGDMLKAHYGVNRLQALCPDALLPIIYLSDMSVGHEGDLLLSRQLMSYRVAKVIENTIQKAPIRLGEWLNQGTHWIVVGGSEVGQAIWQSELQDQGIAVRRESDLEQLKAVLKYSDQVVVIVLDTQTAKQIVDERILEGHVRWVVLEDFSERPDTMTLFNINGQLPDSKTLVRLRQRLKI